MLRRILATIVAALTLVLPIHAFSQENSIPQNLPESRALDAELAKLAAAGKQSTQIVDKLRKEVVAARKDVDRARLVVKAIGKMDDRVAKLLRQLKPMTSIPKVRTVAKFLEKNLKKIQELLHKVRAKVEKFDKEKLEPWRKKLSEKEDELAAALTKLNELTQSVEKTRADLAQAASLAAQNGKARQALERAAKGVRPLVSKTSKTITEVNAPADAILSPLTSLRKSFGSFWTVEKSLNDMDKQMKSTEKVANDLDKVLAKKISFKLPVPPFKEVSFTVRQVLEKPGEVMDVILKPIEALVDKVLDPILKKAKIEIKPPAGLTELAASIDSLGPMIDKLASQWQQLEASLSEKLLGQVDKLLASLKSLPLARK